MPRIDPNQLLKCLSVLLTPEGGIRTKNEVNRLVSLMTKFSKKLVSKCIYILILKSTEVDLLNMFMSEGGWDLTFNWLTDGIQAKNWPLVVELVELLLLCPVTIERLKGNNCPKVIKLLSKDPSATENVRELAGKVVEQWLAIVKGACEGVSIIPPTKTPDIPIAESMEQEEDLEEEPDTENGIDEEIPEEVDDIEDSTQLPIYKITIRDGKQVLAEVISERSTPRVDNVKHVEDKVLVPVSNLVSGATTEPVAGSSKAGKKATSPLHESASNKVTSGKPSSSSDEEVLKPVQLGKKRSLNSKKEPSKRRGGPGASPSNSDPDYTGKPEKKKKSIIPEKKLKVDSKRPRESSSKIKESSKHPKQTSKTSQVTEEQNEKDKATLAKLITPSIGGLGKIPKKNRDDDDKDKKSDKRPIEPVKLPPKDPKKYNISVETRKRTDQERPKTVKMFNSKFRSTGLEEAVPLPKNNKKLDKKEDEEKRPVKRTSPSKDTPPPEKKLKEEEKKADKTQASTKSKIAFLQESDVFADALTAANPVKDTKKKKRRSSTSDTKKEGSPTTSSSSKSEEKKSPEPLKPVLKFYQDTLVTSEDKASDGGGDEKEDVKIKSEIKEELDESLELAEPLEDEKLCPSSPVSKEELEDEVAKAEEAINQVLKLEDKKNVEREKNRLPRGILVYVKKRKGPKKSVQWRPDKDLESTKYFELDETERVNVTKPFIDMKHMERVNEREHILLSRKLAADDVMEEKTGWPNILIKIDIQGEQIMPGKNSLEKDIQYARERTTLQALYFNRRMIPDSPSEPDLEIHATTEPTVIPLDDQTGNAESVISYKGKPWPEPKGYPPGVPEVGIESPPQVIQQTMPQPFHQGPIMAPPGAYPPTPYPPGPFQPHPGAMSGTEWMGGDGNMMPEQMMMGGGGMAQGMGGPPGMMPPGPPEGMFPPMGPPPPEFMAPPPFMGPPIPGMFPPGPPFPGPPGGPDMRPPRPWFRQNGGPPGGTWRHPSKSGSWNHKTRGVCNNYVKKGYCRINNCPYKHPSR